MGQLLVRAIHEEPEFRVAAALESSAHPRFGQDIGEICGLGPLGVPVADEIPANLNCIIDFSIPEAAVNIARICAERRIPLVVATTGLSPAQREELIEYHHDTPLLVASNMSLVVNVLLKLFRDAARLLKDKDFDVEVVERHHRFKTDAPSGTALAFADILAEEMALTERRFGRQGITGERSRREIGIHALRTGDNVGEHTIIFSTLGETMELVHRGHSRQSYVKGAIAAVKFLVAKQPGLYSMADVLGIE
jgi:4-hydroxy-tetrahydrodipicolinate reductase